MSHLLAAVAIRVLGLLSGPEEIAASARVRAVASHSWITTRQAAGIADGVAVGWARYGIPPGILLAVVETESGWSGAAVSNRKCRGWTQFAQGSARSVAGRRLGITRPDLGDPETSVVLTAAYLAELRDRFGSLHHALGAYNAGPMGYVRRGLRNPKYTSRVYGALAGISGAIR